MIEMDLRRNRKNIYELNGLVVVGYSYSSTDNIITVNYDFKENKLSGENSPTNLIKRIRSFSSKFGAKIVCNDNLTRE